MEGKNLPSSAQMLPPCFPGCMQIVGPKCRVRNKLLSKLRKIGAGEGIRTLDPNLGKVVLYP